VRSWTRSPKPSAAARCRPAAAAGVSRLKRAESRYPFACPDARMPPAPAGASRSETWSQPSPAEPRAPRSVVGTAPHTAEGHTIGARACRTSAKDPLRTVRRCMPQPNRRGRDTAAGGCSATAAFEAPAASHPATLSRWGRVHWLGLTAAGTGLVSRVGRSASASSCDVREPWRRRARVGGRRRSSTTACPHLAESSGQRRPRRPR